MTLTSQNEDITVTKTFKLSLNMLSHEHSHNIC